MKTFQSPCLRSHAPPAHGRRERAGALTCRAQDGKDAYYVGIDFGTSGARICAVNGVFLALFRSGIACPAVLPVAYTTVCLRLCIGTRCSRQERQ